MKRAFLITWAVVLVTVGSAACRSSSPVETQRAFGAQMAKQNLWREAMFRFRRAVELNPADAEAHSNLAVALEANGDFEGAAREYREAMRLDKSNQYIQKNYSRFVEFTARNKKREAREPRHPDAEPVKDATPAPPPSGATPAATPASGEKPEAQPAQPAPAPGSEARPAAAAPASPPAPTPATPPPPPTKKPDLTGGAR